MEDLFRSFWWLIFPLFGMFMAVWGTVTSQRRTTSVIDLIKTYTDRGQEPPAELVKLAAKGLESEDDDNEGGSRQSRAESNGWSFFMFAGIAAGTAVAYAFTYTTEDWAWVFLAVSAGFSIMALGALVMLIFFRSKR
jgi:hypothetical protein